MLKLNNMLENVYKQGCYTFAFAHYQVSFGNLRGRRLSTRKKRWRATKCSRLRHSLRRDSLKVYSKNQMHVTLLLYSHNCKEVWRACFPTTESVGLTGVALANLDLLMRSLEFIEEHLEDTVAVQKCFQS